MYLENAFLKTGNLYEGFERDQRKMKCHDLFHCIVPHPQTKATQSFKNVKRGTELLPGLIFAKINFFIIRDMVKTLEYDVFTIIISNFD